MIKVVTALYPFKAIEPGDLTLVKVSKQNIHIKLIILYFINV